MNKHFKKLGKTETVQGYNITFTLQLEKLIAQETGNTFDRPGDQRNCCTENFWKIFKPSCLPAKL